MLKAKGIENHLYVLKKPKKNEGKSLLNYFFMYKYIPKNLNSETYLPDPSLLLHLMTNEESIMCKFECTLIIDGMPKA